MKTILLLILLIIAFPAYAGWGIKDCDPFNKNSGLAKACNQTKKLTICGKSIWVPAFSYSICSTQALILPASCNPTVAAITEGGPCGAAVALTAAACGVSIATVAMIAQSCIDNY